MEDIIIPIAGMISVFGGTILFVKILTDFWTKRNLINKGYVDEKAANILKQYQEEGNKLASLKWGMVTLFGGIGLIVINYTDYYRDSPLPYGIFAVFIALGFLTYYFYVKRMDGDK